MKRNIIITLLIFAFATVYGGDELLTKEITVDPFTGIRACCAIDVYITEGQSSTVLVKADSENLPKVKIDVIDGTLHISQDSNQTDISLNSLKKDKRKIIVYVTAQGLMSLEVDAAAKITGQTTIKAENIKLKADAMGAINIDLKANNLTCKSDAMGNITLNGTASYAKVSADSMGKVDLKGMTVGKADVKADSMGSVDITVKDELKAYAASMGKVNYYGTPSKKETSSDSMGKVKQKK